MDSSLQTALHLATNPCVQSETTCAYALDVLSESEVDLIRPHVATCADCKQELESVRAVIQWFVSWPTDLLRPCPSLQVRLALRLAAETKKVLVLPPPPHSSEQEWEQLGPGIQCQPLATDSERDRVSMLVRVGPGASYPANTHTGMEELYLLEGELRIDNHKISAGDCRYGAAGTNERVWSDTGCTCLLITSTRDALA